jgi:hypothetical protein
MASLHTDLKDIRENSGLSINEINARTKTPVNVIQEIEKGVFFERGDKQKTYIRSFVRTYAKTIGIKDEDMIRALDAQEAGTYAGGLRKKYLPETVHGDLEDPDTSINTSDSNDVANDDEDTGIVRPGPTSTIGYDEFSRPDPSRQHNRVIPPPPKLESVDWAKFSEGFSAINVPVMKVIIIFLVLGMLGVGGYLGVGYLTDLDWSSSADELNAAEAMKTTTDTLNDAKSGEGSSPIADSLSMISTANQAQAIALPDTLYLVVYAQNGKLEPVRVTSDVNNTRSPYWIEQREAMRFDFFNQIAVEGQLDRATFMVNGKVLFEVDSLFQNPNMLIITRDFLSRRPELFTKGQSEIPEDFTQPVIVRDRPVF